jgi:hypothetical protein
MNPLKKRYWSIALIKDAVMSLSSRPALPESLVASCRTAPTASISFDEEKHRLASCRVREHRLYVFACSTSPASQQRWSGNVFEVQAEFARGCPCEEGLTRAARAVQQDAVPKQAITLISLGMEVPLHELADLFLSTINPAEIGEVL